MNAKRKETLNQRSRAYAEAHKGDDGSMYEMRMHCYQDGYRAAMRDARKATKQYISPNTSDVTKLVDSYRGIREFLRPLR